MKNKGIWFVMAGIIAAGILITMMNTVFIKNQAQVGFTAVASQVDVPDSGDGFAPGSDSPAEDEAKGDVPQDDGQDETESVSPDSVVITPLETAAQGPGAETEEGVQSFSAEHGISKASGRMAPPPTGIEADSERNNYRARLDELNQQILRIREEETDSTTYSLKTAAENELKLWDGELNNIYNDILDRLDEDEKAELVSQERDWMKARDLKAVEAAKKSFGGSQEGVEYTASLAQSTKKRAYELADYYDQLTQP